MDLFERTRTEHLVLSQLYRWYLAYERPLNDIRFNNHLELLSDSIIIDSAVGISTGKSGLKERMDLFEGWSNAHHVHNASIEFINPGHVSLEVDILYQNIRADKSRYSFTLHYTSILELFSQQFPIFQSVKIRPTGDADPDLFEDSYAENRSRSLMNYWCYCLENKNRPDDIFKELLSEDFEIEHSKGHIAHNYQEFTNWINSMDKGIQSTAHFPKNFKALESQDGTIKVSLDFDWQGLSLNNEPMHGETHHEWLLENNMDERFARIKKMKIDQTTPFTIIKKVPQQEQL